MTTPLRLIFGGSNRPHHLRMSAFLTAFLATTAFSPRAYDWAAAQFMSHGFLLSHGTYFSLMATAAIACYLQELWATADRDVEERRKPPTWYWLPYGLAVQHRAWASHGPLIGTAIRLAYGWWPLLLLMAHGAPLLLVAWCVGALANDLGHLALDL